MTNKVDNRNEQTMMETFAGWRTVVAVKGNWVKDSQGRSWMVSTEQAQNVQSHMNMRDAWREVEAHASERW